MEFHLFSTKPSVTIKTGPWALFQYKEAFSTNMAISILNSSVYVGNLSTWKDGLCIEIGLLILAF